MFAAIEYRRLFTKLSVEVFYEGRELPFSEV
jgi:hypothetical protein